MADKELVKANDLKEVVIFDVDMGFDGFEGTEGDADSYSTPFLKVLQSDSPTCLEGDDAYDPEAKNGEFFNTVTEERYGRDINLIVVYTERVYNEYKPSRGGFVGSHDRVTGKALIRDMSEYPFVNINTGNNLVETLTFYCLNADDIEAGPIVFALSSTSLKHGKAFLSRASMMKMIRDDHKVKAPLFSSIYNFATRLVSNDKGKWWQVVKTSIKRVGNINDEQKLAVAEAYKLFKTEGIDYAKAEEPAQGEMDFGEDSEKEPF